MGLKGGWMNGYGVEQVWATDTASTKARDKH